MREKPSHNMQSNSQIETSAFCFHVSMGNFKFCQIGPAVTTKTSAVYIHYVDCSSFLFLFQKLYTGDRKIYT